MNRKHHKLRYWFLLKPDIRAAVGGVKQMHRLVEAFGKLNRQATLIQEQADFHPDWFLSNVNTISEAEWLQKDDLKPSTDIVVMPETYSGELLSYARSLPKIIFNQNGSYSFGDPDKGLMHRPGGLMDVYGHPLIRHILCVSEYDRELIGVGFNAGLERVSVIRNSIETDIFRPSRSKKKQLCYMSRKNPRDALIVVEMLSRCKWFESWNVVPIKNQPLSRVAEIMNQSLVFLSFGHPEGFGLPVAEAMASACYVIGYSGLGGRELFRLGQQWTTCNEIAVGDWLGFIKSLERVNDSLQRDSARQIKLLLGCSKETRMRYSEQEMLNSLETALRRIEGLAF